MLFEERGKDPLIHPMNINEFIFTHWMIIRTAKYSIVIADICRWTLVYHIRNRIKS